MQLLGGGRRGSADLHVFTSLCFMTNKWDGKLVFSLRLAGTLEILFWRNVLSFGGCHSHSVSWSGHPLKVRGEASPPKNGGDRSPFKVRGFGLTRGWWHQFANLWKKKTPLIFVSWGATFHNKGCNQNGWPVTTYFGTPQKGPPPKK